MKCPFCEADKTSVVKTKEHINESLSSPSSERRRKCHACKQAFYTYEIYANDWRMVEQLMGSADLLEHIAGLVRTRLTLNTREGIIENNLTEKSNRIDGRSKMMRRRV